MGIILLLLPSSGSLAGYLTFKSSVSISIMGVTQIKWTSTSEALPRGLALSKCLVKVYCYQLALGTSVGSDFPSFLCSCGNPREFFSAALDPLLWVSAGIPMTVAAFPSKHLCLCPSHVSGSAGEVLAQQQQPLHGA